MAIKLAIITEIVLKQLSVRYGQHPICRFCRVKIKVGDRVVSMRGISKNTAWFRKYIHEECYENSLSNFMPLLLAKSDSKCLPQKCMHSDTNVIE